MTATAVDAFSTDGTAADRTGLAVAEGSLDITLMMSAPANNGRSAPTHPPAANNESTSARIFLTTTGASLASTPVYQVATVIVATARIVVAPHIFQPHSSGWCRYADLPPASGNISVFALMLFKLHEIW